MGLRLDRWTKINTFLNLISSFDFTGVLPVYYTSKPFSGGVVFTYCKKNRVIIGVFVSYTELIHYYGLMALRTHVALLIYVVN